MKDLDPDRIAILAVIEEETNAYMQRDYDRWQACWSDGPHIQRVHSHVGTGVTVYKGDAVREQMRQLLLSNQNPPHPAGLCRKNFDIVINTDMAWVTYDQSGESGGFDQEFSGQYHELKILHKEDGAWKIACIIGNQKYAEVERSPSIELDAKGRVLWMNDAARSRLPEHPMLSQSGGRLLAKDETARRDISDALDWLHHTRDLHKPCLGIDIVIRAISLGQDDSGLIHICWATLRDGKFLIIFDDAHRIEQQIACAADVYGLSQSQAKLVRCLFDGKDLSTAAKDLGISPNTAKTHLQRMYDKTGVRSQPALVRLLLNAERRGL
jgi:DNA-binding CsgD family transcriptional regulator